MIKQLKINFIKNDDIIGFIYGFIIFLSCQPYFIWGAGTFFTKLPLIAVVISFFYIRKFNKYDLIIIPLFGFYFIYLFGSSGISRMVYNSVFLSIIFIREDKLLFFLNWFKKIFVVSLALSLVVYILVILFSVPINYTSLAPLNELKAWDYKQYPFFVIENHLGFEYRFCGMFDEPGVVGSIVTILLFADNYNLKKKQNIILLIAGIFSFSFFFIICSILYLFYLSSNKTRLIFISLFIFLFLATRNNDIIYYMVWDRFAIEDGRIKGDNRSTDDLDAIYSQFLSTNDVIWGKGEEYATRHELDDSSTYKLVVLNYGMVFFVVVCLAFSLYAFFIIKKLKYVLIYCFLFYGMMYQRPGLIYNVPLFFLMIASIYAIKSITDNSTAQTELPDNQAEEELLND